LITDLWADGGIEETAAHLARDTTPTNEEKRGIYAQGAVLYFDYIMKKHNLIT